MDEAGPALVPQEAMRKHVLKDPYSSNDWEKHERKTISFGHGAKWKENQPLKSKVKKQTPLDFCCHQESKICVHDTCVYSESESSQGGQERVGREEEESWHGRSQQGPKTPSRVNCIFKKSVSSAISGFVQRAFFQLCFLFCCCDKISHFSKNYSTSGSDSDMPA